MTTHSQYWCDRKLLVTVNGPEGRACTTVDKPFARIGSHESAEVVLARRSVGRRRLYLHATDTGVFCVDLSRGPSRKPAAGGWLSPGQTLRLGPYEISVRLEGEGRADLAEPDLDLKGSAAAPYPVVVASTKGRELGTCMLTRRLTLVGRHRRSAIQLTSRSVSAPHCAIYRHSDTLWVIDLLSGNGTCLEGRPVEVTEFPFGSSLTLGKVELAYLSRSNGREVSVGYDPEQSAVVEAVFSAEGLEEEPPWLAPPQVESEEDDVSTDEEQRPAENESALALQPPPVRPDELEAERRALEQGEAALRAAEEETHRRQAEWEQRAAQERIEQSCRAAQLEVRAGELEAQQARLSLEQEDWAKERKRQEDELADRARRQEEEAARLASRQETLEKEQAAWQQERAEQEKRLADRAGELGRQYAELCSERERWEAERVDHQLSQAASEGEQQAAEVRLHERLRALGDREAELERQREALQQQHDEWILREDESRARREALQADLEASRGAWEEMCRQKERELVARSEDLARERAELESERRQVEAERLDLERRMTAFQTERQSVEARLEEQQEAGERRQAELKAEDQALQGRRDEWLSEQSQREAEWQRRSEELEREANALDVQKREILRQRQQWQQRAAEDAAEQSRQAMLLEERIARLQIQEEEFRSRQARWEADRQKAEEELASLRQRIDKTSAQPASPSQAIESHPAHTPQEEGLPAGGVDQAQGVRPASAATTRRVIDRDEIADSADHDRALEALLSFHRRKRTRWDRIASALFRPFRRTRR